MNRREFLRLSGLAAVGAACSPALDGDGARPGEAGGAVRPPGAPAAPELAAPLGGQPVGTNSTVTLAWHPTESVDTYSVELNGQIVATDLDARVLQVGAGDRSPGLVEGVNTWRVKAANETGEAWSAEETFEARADRVIRVRRFDHEDDGRIDVTVPSSTSALVIGSAYAYTGVKGAQLLSTNKSDTRAYKNHHQLPVAECWVRLAVRPQAWEQDDVSIALARIRAMQHGGGERLLWRTGRDLTTSSLRLGVTLDPAEWVQVQMGVKDDGTVELWIFDGTREFLVGRAHNADLVGTVKDAVSLGNDSWRDGITYEVWLDGFAVGERKLPWVRPGAEAVLNRPPTLDPQALPDEFSFVFGSCNVASFVPYTGTAVAAAAATDPDFMVHLGDYCYPDSGAYLQTESGYRALWSDTAEEQHLNKLIRKPWIYLASDHDLGGNNVDSQSISAFATDAYASWNPNPRAADPDGRYGSMLLDQGRVMLMWIEGIAFRSPLEDEDGPEKIVLGPAQKAWFLRTLEQAEAQLIIIASQTTIGHGSATAWAQYSIERSEVVQACLAANAAVRWITGDLHNPRWSRIGDLVEWGAAPLAEVPQGCLDPDPPDVDETACMAFVDGGVRREILETLSRDEINEATSFGRVVINGRDQVATFEVRDGSGKIRVTPQGFRMQETIWYGRA